VAGDVAIVEVLVNPSAQDSGREWIEIASLARDRLDLSELHLADAVMEVAVPAGTIEAGARVVLAQSADPARNGGVSGGFEYGTRLALNNDGEQLTLCRGACAEGVVVARLAWGNLGAAYDGHALVVDPASQAQCPAEVRFGTAGDYGTPGGPNPTCPSGGADSGAD